MPDYSTERRERQIDRAVTALRRQFPHSTLSQTEIRSLARTALAAGDDEPDAGREWALEVVGKAGDFVQALLDQPDGNSAEVRLARRNLTECFSRPEQVEEFELRGPAGETRGLFKGTRRDYEKTQAAIRS